MEHVDDQIHAATAEARHKVAVALGLPADFRGTGDIPPFVQELFDKRATVDEPRCAHLMETPFQVWTLTLPFPGWRCGRCVALLQESMRGRSLGEVEENTCDRCRRYLPSAVLSVSVIRVDFWVIVASLCQRCVGLAEQQGAAVVDPPTGAA